MNNNNKTQSNKYLTPQQKQRQALYKAADLSVEWQNAWKDFMSSPSHPVAKSVINKGEALLEEQERLSMQFQKRDYIRHRILVAEDFLQKNDLKNNPDRHERMNQSDTTKKLQKWLDGL